MHSSHDHTPFPPSRTAYLENCACELVPNAAPVGESEFECGVKGNLHIKAHCRGWCQFFRLAREKYAQMVVLQADGCQLVLLRGENIELVQPGTVYDMREVAGMDEITSNAKFAVREHHQLDFLVRGLYEGEYARDTRGGSCEC